MDSAVSLSLRLALGSWILAVCLIAIPVSGHAADERKTVILTVRIPMAALADSLEILSRQFGLQLIYDAGQLGHIPGPAVVGSFNASQALDRLLAGSAFRAIEEQPGTFLITRSPASRKSQGPPVQHAESLAKTDIDEITVTGTHLRGAAPVGAALIVYDEDALKRLGLNSVEGLGRVLIPNFSGADSLATVNTNGNVGNLAQGAVSNEFGGAGFDLLGLGPGSTLTLLNGHRIAPGGLDGSLVDISLIPLSAIERVEILMDGASAIYGSDAVAGVVNLVTRRRLEGVETSLRYGLASEGGAGEYTASQLAGTHWANGSALVDYEFADQKGLDARQREWIAPENGPYSLIPENRRNSFFLSGDQTWGTTEMQADVLYSTRQFRTNGIAVDNSSFVPVSDSATGHANLAWVSVTAGHPLFATWHSDLTATYSGMRQRRNGIEYVAGYGGPSFDSELTADSDIGSLQFSAGGSVVPLPAGMVQLSLGGDLQAESFTTSALSLSPLPTVTHDRIDTSLFAEEKVPLVGGGLSYPGIRRMDISVAVRYDRYSQVGSTTNPKWGLTWEPVERLVVRATDGSSFKAPLLAELSAPTTMYTTLLPSMTPGGKPSDVLIIDGGNPGLRSQKSQFITAGLDWEPLWLLESKISATYFNVKYHNRIQAQNVQDAPLGFQPQLTALFSLPAIDAGDYFVDPGFQRDGAGLGPSGVTDVLDNRLANVATTDLQGLYFDAHTSQTWNVGKLGASMTAQYLLADRTQFSSYASSSPVASTIGEPPQLRMQAGLSWDWRLLNTTLLIHHTGSYQNPLVSPADRVASWTTEDVNLGVTIPSVAGSPLHGSLVFSVQNVTDHRPPFINIPLGGVAIDRAAVPFDGTNASAIGRFVALELRLGW